VRQYTVGYPSESLASCNATHSNVSCNQLMVGTAWTVDFHSVY